MTQNTMLSCALTYAVSGVQIFPCREADGRGGNAKAPYIEGGWHRATCDLAQVGAWWRSWPKAAIGLPCRKNGMIAIDADRHGATDGVAGLLALCQRHGFDAGSVPVIATPRNGLHLLFQRPKDLGDTRATVAEAIDTRDNGYVIAAGSIMANGYSYRLCNGTVEALADAVGRAALPLPPDWLTALLAKPIAAPSTCYRPPNPTVPPIGDMRPRLSGLVRTVVLARQGERNATLHWAACRLGELVRQGQIHPDAALALIVEAGRHAGLSSREAAATARSGLIKALKG